MAPEALMPKRRGVNKARLVGSRATATPHPPILIQVDVVEVSETVIDMAEKHFGFSSCRRGNTKACQQRLVNEVGIFS